MTQCYLTTLLTSVHMYPHLLHAGMSHIMPTLPMTMCPTTRTPTIQPGVGIKMKISGMIKKVDGIKSGTTSIRKLKLNGIPCKINGVKSGVTLLVQIQILNKLQKQKSMNQYQHQNQQDLSLQSKNAVVKQLVENPSVTTSASFTSTTQSMESRNAKIHITLHGLTTTHAQQVTDGS